MNRTNVHTAEISFETCKAHSQALSKQIKEWLIPTMERNGIAPSLSLFADLQTQPVICNDPNPYKVLMNVLNQFAGVVSGGYDATIKLESANREIEQLKKSLDQLTHKQ